MCSNVRQKGSILLIFARSRRVFVLLAMSMLVSILVIVFGGFLIGAPSAARGGTAIPLVRLSSFAPGVLAVLVLTSQLRNLEAAAGAAVRRLETLTLLAVFVAASLLFLTGSVISAGLQIVPLISRALLAWLGLALISGRIFGWRTCWLLPGVVLCVLIYWGFDSVVGAYRWWEFTATGTESVSSSVLSVALLVGGLLAYAWTPWRIACMRRRFFGLISMGGSFVV